MSTKQSNLLTVDWSLVAPPRDDGAAAHLTGMMLPEIALIGTHDRPITLAKLRGRTVVFAYPRTGVPGKPSLAEDWDQIPGARGCTPQSCAFRDLHRDLKDAGAATVFGLSTQSTPYQREARDRLHLPFELLSDESLAFSAASTSLWVDFSSRVIWATSGGPRACSLIDGYSSLIWRNVFV